MAKQLLRIVEFVMEKSPIPSMPEYVVDALWDKTALLKDWKAMADLSQNESLLSSDQHQVRTHT